MPPGVYLVALQAGHDANQVDDITCLLNLQHEDGSDMVKGSKPAMVRNISRSAGDIVAIMHTADHLCSPPADVSFYDGLFLCWDSSTCQLGLRSL